MGAELSKKREGEKSNLKKKIVPEVLKASNSANYDVTIIVDGQRFQCLKEKLSQHSFFFQMMFNSNFKETNKTEVELRGVVESEPFDLFLKVIHGERVISDSTVEKLLELADYLESATLEASCMRHLATETELSLKQQFQMAETHHSEKLMIQVCASIKDAHELDEVVPKDLDSFCNTTKNIVMQRSFELLGIRKPQSPPLPENPDRFFEHMLNQVIDQVEVQNHHGEVLKDQVHLLSEHVFIEKRFREKDGAAEVIFREDPLIKELLDQLKEAHDQGERNFIHAQIQVLKLKHLYIRLQDREFNIDEVLRPVSMFAISCRLGKLSAMLNRDEQSRSRSHKVTLGNREIDELYRRLTAEAVENNEAEPRRNVNDRAAWFQGINDVSDSLKGYIRFAQQDIERTRPDNQREVSNRASFRLIDEFVRNARNLYYSVPRIARE